ncbi:hypothetical protein RHOSPDRAFT_13263, partial [Rhodotorula sp. JG-1b]
AVRQLHVALDNVAELARAEEQLMAARSSRRRRAAAAQGDESTLTTTKSCTACRRGKNRCLPSADPQICQRCSEVGERCEHPISRNRGPKKRLSKTQKALKAIQQNIEAVLSGNPTPEVRLDGVDDSESDGCARQPHRMSDLHSGTSLLRNPLALLAHQAQVRLDQGTSATESSAVPPVPRAEENLALDPVDCGILSYDDLCRLHTLYFTHLYPFLWILLPELHTVEYLRLRSPFLTTSLAFVASTFDPGSALLTPALGRHALALAVHVFEKDLKTLEIVQAYFLLSHWASPNPGEVETRAFHFLGQAWRIAVELRLNTSSHPSFPHPHGLQEAQSRAELLARNRKLTWLLLFCGELAICVQTGRLEAIRIPPIPAFSYSPVQLPPELPDYDYAANMHANIILARSIQHTTTLQTSSDVPEAQRAKSFMAFWKPAMAEWRAQWPNVNSFIDIHAENNTIMLNFMTLRFRGASSVEILAECRAAAIRTVDKVATWNDCVADLRYASNFSVVNIAYGATLLLQLTLNLDHHVDAAVLGKIRNVAYILQRVGQSRPNAISVATLHAERILALIETIAAKADRADAASSAHISSIASSEPGHALRHLQLHPPVWP